MKNNHNGENRIAIEFCKKKLQSPFILTSGPLCYGAEGMIKGHQAGAGAVVTKTIRLGPAVNPIGHIARFSQNSLINTEKWADIPFEQWCETEIPLTVTAGATVIASVGHTLKEAKVIAAEVEKAGSHMIELVSRQCRQRPEPGREPGHPRPPVRHERRRPAAARRDATGDRRSGRAPRSARPWTLASGSTVRYLRGGLRFGQQLQRRDSVLERGHLDQREPDLDAFDVGTVLGRNQECRHPCPLGGIDLLPDATDPPDPPIGVNGADSGDRAVSDQVILGDEIENPQG